MKITIKINKKIAEHLSSPHTFYDECEPACALLRLVQREIDKKLPKKNNKLINKKINKPTIVRFKKSDGTL
ncbi:MAG TPA: hypothetical protein VGB37_14870 [Candidatus Lokiarchaeia archaeon]